MTIALSVIIESAASMHVFFTTNEVFLVGLMIRANASIFDRVFADSQYSRLTTHEWFQRRRSAGNVASLMALVSRKPDTYALC